MPQYTKHSNYGYTPTEAWCAAFIALFGLTALVHCIQAGRSKYWVVYPTLVLGAVIECMGWSARLWSSKEVLRLDPFLMQICLLIMAPVFFSAYDYAVLGTAIHNLGEQYSILRPNYYFIIFMTADLVSLILQAIGGGKAASTAASGAPTKMATDIMVAGIIFQLVVMAAFIACGLDFCIRVQIKKPYAFQQKRLAGIAEKKSSLGGEVGSDSERNSDAGGDVERVKTETDKEAQGVEMGRQENSQKALKKWWIMMLGVGISAAMIFVRGVFRSIELSKGWDSKLATTEIYQCVLDGIPMVIAVAIFNFINPLYVLPRKEKWAGYY